MDRDIAGLAARQYGVFTRAQVRELGAGRSFIEHRSRAGRWEPVERSVYRLAGVPGSWRQTLLIAVFSWGPGATVSHRSSAKLRGLAGVERELVELTVPVHRRGGCPVVVHRNRLDDLDVIGFEGIQTTTVARTLIDLAAVARVEAVEEALDDALRRNLVSIALVRSRLDDLSGRGGRHGVSIIRRLLDARDG